MNWDLEILPDRRRSKSLKNSAILMRRVLTILRTSRSMGRRVGSVAIFLEIFIIFEKISCEKIIFYVTNSSWCLAAL